VLRLVVLWVMVSGALSLASIAWAAPPTRTTDHFSGSITIPGGTALCDADVLLHVEATNTFTQFGDGRYRIHTSVVDTFTNLENEVVITATTVGETIGKGTVGSKVQVGVIQQIRDASGKLVSNSTGKIVFENFQPVSNTANADPDLFGPICSALGANAVYGGM